MNRGGSHAAEALHPDLPGGRVAGQLEVTREGLRFEGSGLSIDLPRAGLVLRTAGIENEILVFSHPAHPQWAFATRDRRILDYHALIDLASVRRVLCLTRWQTRRFRLCVAALGVLLAALVGGAVMLWRPLVSRAVEAVPPGVEASLGAQLLRQLEATGGIVADPEVDRLLTELAAPLLAAARRRHELTLHILDDATADALALPGGPVVLHSGLVLRASRPEQLLGVIAHEIAHVNERHSLRQLVAQAGLWTVIRVAFGDGGDLAASVAEGGAGLIELEYSPDLEREADDRAFEYLVAAGIDPTGLISFFQELLTEAEDQKLVVTFFAAHPASDDRVGRLAAKLQRLPVRLRPRPRARLEALQVALVRQPRSRSSAE